MICELAKISEISEGIWYEFSLQVEYGLLSIMLIKHDGQYSGYQNICPHQGRRMDYATGQFLLTESGNIVCPAHGAEFNADTGLCINGPCKGQSLQSVTIKSNEESIFTVIK